MTDEYIEGLDMPDDDIIDDDELPPMPPLDSLESSNSDDQPIQKVSTSTISVQEQNIIKLLQEIAPKIDRILINTSTKQETTCISSTEYKEPANPIEAIKLKKEEQHSPSSTIPTDRILIPSTVIRELWKKTSSIISKSQSQDFESALQQIERTAQELLVIINTYKDGNRNETN